MKTREEKIEKFLNNLSIDMDITNYIEVEEVNCFEDIREQLFNANAFHYEGEIIYYASAMEYLMKNDPSLQESLGYAFELGYTTDNLNSEILASILKANYLMEEFDELENEIESFFDELNESVEQ